MSKNYLSEDDNFKTSITLLKNINYSTIDSLGENLSDNKNINYKGDKSRIVFDLNQNKTRAYISDEEFKITCYINDAKNIYDKILDLTDKKSIDIPAFNELHIPALSIETQLVNNALTYNDEKFDEFTLGGCKYSYNNIDCVIMPENNSICIYFDSEARYNDVLDFLDYAINNNFFIIKHADKLQNTN